MDQEPELSEEPKILPLSAFRQPDPSPDNDHQPDHPEQSDDESDRHETFWAGRNHAMRRSARWAA